MTYHLYPNEEMTYHEQIMSVARLILVLFLIMVLFRFPYQWYFLLISFVLLLVYYKMNRPIEHYGPVGYAVEPVPEVKWDKVRYGSDNFVFSRDGRLSKTQIKDLPLRSNPSIIDLRQTSTWCPPHNTPLEPDQGFVSPNQKLAGPANPKTLIQPIIYPPIYGKDITALNDFIVPMAINDYKRQELYQNGYVTEEFTSEIHPSTYEPYIPIDPPPHLLDTSVMNAPSHVMNMNALNVANAMNAKHRRAPIESYMPSEYASGSGLIDQACAKNDPENLYYNMPINYNSGRCEKTDEMAAYNDQIFTSTVVPHVYDKIQVNQPDAVSSNLGISFQQQFLPTQAKTMPNGDVVWTEYASDRLPDPPLPDTVSEPNPSNVYDPRFTGYGTQSRSYWDEFIGQPRYYYDDVDAVRQPNYITRNMIDTQTFGTKVGVPNSEYSTFELREMANQSYIDNTTQHRTELQQRLMHKNNARRWQLRQAPMYTYA